MAKRVLGLYADDLQVQYCLLKEGITGYTIENIVFYNREQIANRSKNDITLDVREALKDLVVDSDTLCVTGLQGKDVMYRHIKRPFADRRKISQTIGPEVETLLPAGEEYIVDFVITGKDDAGETLIQAVAAKVSSLKIILKICKELNIDPEIVESPSCALASGARNFFDLSADKTYLVLYFGWRNTALTVMRGDSIVYVFSFPLGFHNILTSISAEKGVPVESLLEKAFSDGIEAGVHLERLVTEINIVLNRLEPELKVGTYNLIPSGYAVYIKDFSKIFINELELVDEMPPLKELDTTYSTKDILKEFMAVSLAYRRNDNEGFVNFRQGEFAYTKRIDEIKDYIVFVGKALAVLLVIWVLNLGMNVVFEQSIVKKLDAKIKKEFTSVMPKGSPMVTPVKQMEQQEDRLKKQLGGFQGGAATPLDIMRDISTKVQKDLDLVLDGINIDENGVSISGNTESYDNVSKVEGSLSSLQYFKEVKIISTNMNKTTQRVDFKISCTGGEE